MNWLYLCSKLPMPSEHKQAPAALAEKFQQEISTNEGIQQYEQ
jgi:hypothetical protein